MYIKDWVYDKKWKLIHWVELQKYIHASVKLARQVSSNYYCFIYLMSSNYSPRIDIVVRRKSNYDYDKCVKLERLFEKFDDKWFNNVSLDQYDLELNSNNITDSIRDTDIQLKQKFIKRLSYHYINSDGDTNMLWCNCVELINNKTVN